MIAAGVENEVSRHSAVYWRDLAFGRVLPALFFSVFLVRYLLTVWDGLHSIRQPSDYLFVVQQGLALAYFTMLVPGGVRRDWLVLPADIIATVGLAYSVWALAYLRRSFSIIPEARRLVTGGPYRLSRHPVYLGEILTAIGINLATTGWLGALAILYFIGCELLRMRWEEGVLSRAFPADYPEYARTVPRYAPNPFRKSS